MDRFIDAPTDYEYLATVDGTDFHRQEDYTKHDPGLYSHKLNNPGYRYEVAVGVFSGEIVSLNGPFNAGSNSDVKIFRSDLKQKLGENEKALADRGYRGDEDIVTNYDKDIVFEEKRRRSRELALHENVNEYFKRWSCLTESHFRHSTMSHSKEQRVMMKYLYIQYVLYILHLATVAIEQMVLSTYKPDISSAVIRANSLWFSMSVLSAKYTPGSAWIFSASSCFTSSITNCSLPLDSCTR